jgi:hypothetical protein
MRLHAALVLSLTAACLAGCGGGSSDEEADSPVVRSTASGPAPSAGGCDTSVALEIKAATATNDAVTEVTVIGSCTEVALATSLGTTQDDADQARSICETAANEAYAKGLSSVLVESSDGTQLAVGTKGASCFAEPR